MSELAPPARDTPVKWRSKRDAPRADDFSEYIVWCPDCACPGAYIGRRRPTRDGNAVWVTAAGIMLFPTHWAPLGEVFDPRRLEAP